MSKSFLQDLEEQWNVIHQESLTRRRWIREMDESLKKVEWSRADKVSCNFNSCQLSISLLLFAHSAGCRAKCSLFPQRSVRSARGSVV